MGQVESVMIRDVAWVDQNEPLRTAVQVMSKARISCLVVCDDSKPIGILTERDLPGLALRLLEGRDESRTRIGQLMSTPVITVKTDDSLEAARMMAERRGIRHLPVVNAAGEIAGLLTQTDMLRAYSRDIEALVIERTEQLEQANRRLEEKALEDPLTGLRNRRAMEEDLDALHARFERTHQTYSVILCDVDYFKGYNDHYGHLEGDDILRRLAGSVVGATHWPDTTYRYGGEEILVLLPETTREGAEVAAERIRAAIEILAIPHELSEHGQVTVSSGHATASRGFAGSWKDLVELADKALYRAKAAGRNCVIGD